MVKRYRGRRDGGTGGSNATGASHRALIHAGWCGGMSEEAGRVSGAWPPLTDGDDTVVDVLRKRCGVNIIKYSERDKIMSFFAQRGHMCYRNDGIFFIIFGDGEVSEKFPLRGLPSARLRLWSAAYGG